MARPKHLNEINIDVKIIVSRINAKQMTVEQGAKELGISANKMYALKRKVDVINKVTALLDTKIDDNLLIQVLQEVENL